MACLPIIANDRIGVDKISPVKTCIHVEFFGLARRYAGVPTFDLQLREDEASLGDLIIALESHLPQLVDACIVNHKIAAGFVVNLDGQRFVSNNDADVSKTQSVILMSVDAGG